MAPEFYDIRILRGSRTRIVLDNGKLEEIAQAPFQGAAVRALYGGAWGFVTTDNVDRSGEEIDLAKRIARKIDRRRICSWQRPRRAEALQLPVKKDPKNLSLEEKVALLREIEDAAKGQRRLLHPGRLLRDGFYGALQQFGGPGSGIEDDAHGLCHQRRGPQKRALPDGRRGPVGRGRPGAI